MAPPHKKARLSADKTGLQNGDVQKAVADNLPSPGGETAAETAEEEKQKQQRRSLFVRSLPASTTTETLTDLFSQTYPIKHATAVIDRDTKLCKGFGFVTFADAEDCQRAKEEFDNYTLDGRKIRVELAEPRHRDQDGGPPVQTAVQKAKEKREKDRADARPPKLIVRNLPWSIKTSEQLSKLFMSYGKVKFATIPNTKPGLMAGFGFITMRGKKNAERALQGVNGKEIDGRTLAVDWAVEKGVWQGMQDGDAEVEKQVPENGAQPGPEDHLDEDEHEGLGVVDGSGGDDDEGSVSADDDEDMEGEAEDMDDEAEDDIVKNRTEDKSSTLFIRNIPFTCTDETLDEHFTQFGAVRYARVVLDNATERPRGTGFVCFYKMEDADECIRNSPRSLAPRPADGKSKGSAAAQPRSILQNDESDPSGKYTLDGRVLQVSRAVNKSDANRLTQEGVAYRNHRDRDKRRLYLLSEGTIASNSPLYEKLSPSERTMREASAKQRKSLIESNPTLHLSLTRLSIRNIPRTITSKDLKQLAREAVVGFAIDVKAGNRQRLSKEELARGGDEMQAAEQDRRARAKGIIKQAKIVFEGREGSKVTEDSGAGRSRGYGFIEYFTHRSALMGLRWLNGHSLGYQTHEMEAKGKSKKLDREVIMDRKKRLVAEFAIENAQVVLRRKEREDKARDKSAVESTAKDEGKTAEAGKAGDKRKRDGADGKDEPDGRTDEDEKLAKRQRIIQKKRMVRRARKKGGKA